MKTTTNGYKLNKNGKPILSLSPNEIFSTDYKGNLYKENGTYYYYVGKRGTGFIYTV